MKLLNFAPNLENLRWLVDLESYIGLIWLNCSDCSHSLLPDFWKVFATNLLRELVLCTGRLFSWNFGFECKEGISDAIGVFKLGLLGLYDSVNCYAIAGEKLECGESDAINLYFGSKILLFGLGVCSANGLIGFELGDFNFNMLVYAELTLYLP